MDVQSAASQLIKALGNNPDLVSQFAQHPYSTTAKVTGTDETISQKDMSRILTQVAAQASGQELDKGGTKDLASALMSQSGGSVHQLASTLFGGAQQPTGSAGGLDLGSVLGALGGGSSSSSGPSMAEIAAKSIAGGLAARGMAALITGALTGGKGNAAGK